MSHLLYAVAMAIDGERSLAQIAGSAGAQLGRELTPEDAAYLIDSKLRPAGIIASTGEPALIKPADPPILGLRFRARVIPARFVSAASRLATPLFFPPVVLAVIAAVGIFDYWLLFDHGVAQATQHVLMQPTLVLVIFGLTLAATAMHELGHATACRYGGARPGVIGVGIYLVWPVFYSDVTDSYRLGRAGRLRTDLGGVYFNVVSSALMAAAYLVTRYDPLLLAILLVQMDALHQFFPFFRLDGYYVASDLIGVPDLFMRLRPMLASFIPGRPIHPQVKALRTWARYAVATWVFLTFAVIASLYVLLIMALPRVLATAWQSFMLHLVQIGYFAHHGSPGGVALAVIDEVMLAFPMLALAATSLYVGRRLLKTWALLGEGRPTKRMAVAIAAAIILVIPLPSLSTASNYQPIKPSERGTIPPPSDIQHQLAPATPFGFANGGDNRPAIAPPSSSPSAGPSQAPSAPSQAAAPPADSSPAASPSPDPTPDVTPSPSPSDSPLPSDSPTPADSPSPSPTDAPSPTDLSSPSPAPS